MNAALDTTAGVETPEHVRFEYRIAGPARRGFAWLVDTLTRLVVVGGFMMLGGGGFGMSTGALLVIAFLVEWGWFVGFETLWSGRSPGKRLLGLRVVRESGHPITFSDSVLRNLLRAADFLPFFYALGVMVSGLDPRFRRLGDLVAGTMVVTEERGVIAAAAALEPPPTVDELAALPHRPPLDADELDALELFVRRLGTLNPLREDELAEIVAPVFAERLGGTRYDSASRFLGLLHARVRGPQ